MSGQLAQCKEGQVVWKSVNTNPGLNVNRSLNTSCIEMFFTALFCVF